MIDLKTLKKLVKQGLSAALGLSEETEQIKPIAPLIQRLSLPEMPNALSDSLFANRQEQRAKFVRDVIARNYPNGVVSRRMVAAITSHYGLNLHGRDFFQATTKVRSWENKRNRQAMLIILPTAA